MAPLDEPGTDERTATLHVLRELEREFEGAGTEEDCVERLVERDEAEELEEEEAPEREGLSEERFLWLANGLGYRPLVHGNGYLLAAIKPRWAWLFEGCVCRRYQPESATNPLRERVEITWWRP